MNLVEQEGAEQQGRNDTALTNTLADVDYAGTPLGRPLKTRPGRGVTKPMSDFTLAKPGRPGLVTWPALSD
jgi:hypothetical protein